VRTRQAVQALSAFLLIATMTSASGCFDIHTARQILYPPDNDKIVMERGPIAQVMYDFQGPVDAIGVVQVGSAEFHREIDNFHIAPGGGDLFVRVEIHFIPDTLKQISFTSYINVTLSYLPEDVEPEVLVQSSYESDPDSEVLITDDLGNIADLSTGLWSLRVEGVGTSVLSGNVKSYDWFKVWVNGQYSDRSYNNNSPDEGSTPA
jgi:hypothetical protein